MTTGKKYSKDKLFAKITHTASSGVVGLDEYETFGEVKLSIATDFTTSGTLTVQGRIKYSSSWQAVGTLTSGGDFDSFDIDVYDYIRFNFTVAAGSTGEIAASGFFKASSSGGGASSSFTTIQADAGTNPVADSSTDTLTITSGDGSVVVTGNSTTDTIALTTPAASASSLGHITTGTQTIAGSKTYTSSLSCTTAGTQSERFGATATATPDNSTAIGYGAVSYAVQSTAVGDQALANTSCTAIGRGSWSSGSYSIAVGRTATVNYNYGCALGANALSNHVGAISLGYQSISTATNQFVVGSSSSSITHVYFGNGVATASPVACAIHSSSGSGTNIAGVDLTLAAGQGTGTGVSGEIILQTATAGTTGSSLNALADRLVIDTIGNIGIGTSSPVVTALLELSSTTKGFLPPRLTTTERGNITSPATGLTIYNTTTNKLNFYSGSAWEAVTSA